MDSKSTLSLPLRAVGYRRVSMRDQVDNFSLDAQENNIRHYVESRGWQLVEIYVDAGISAKKGSHRPAFERLIKDAAQNKFDVVVVDKIDRFYRHLNGLLTTLDTLHGHGVSFASVQEQLDFTSPWGKLMLTVLGTLAEIYLENLRQEPARVSASAPGKACGWEPFPTGSAMDCAQNAPILMARITAPILDCLTKAMGARWCRIPLKSRWYSKCSRCTPAGRNPNVASPIRST